MDNNTQAQKALQDFINLYSTLDEKQKFALGATFNEQTGGKLSPYNSPQPVAVALIPTYNPNNGDTFILLGQRSIAPKIGEFALPGGFFEPGENGGEAAAREVQEEFGLALDPNKFESFYKPLTNNRNHTLNFMLYKETLPLNEIELNQIMKDNGCSEMTRIVPLNIEKLARIETSYIHYKANGEEDSAPIAFPFHVEVLQHLHAQEKKNHILTNGDIVDVYIPYTKPSIGLKMR